MRDVVLAPAILRSVSYVPGLFCQRCLRFIPLSRIKAPTLITFGSRDLVTSTRFAEPMTERIRDSELYVFEGCSHGTFYEKVEQFNQQTLSFLRERATAHAA